MANILKRFGDIMSANISALLDKAEDPEKMIDKYLRDVEEDLGKVKADMHDKLAKDMESLQAKRDAIKAKVAVAKTQEKLNKMSSSISGAGEAMAAFERMETKADQMLDEANAMAELNDSGDRVEDLAKKYDSDADASAAEDELAALKAKMGL